MLRTSGHLRRPANIVRCISLFIQPSGQVFTGEHCHRGVAFYDGEEIAREAPKMPIGCEELQLRGVSRLRSRVFPHFRCQTHLNRYLTSATYAVHPDPDVLLRRCAPHRVIEEATSDRHA